MAAAGLAAAAAAAAWRRRRRRRCGRRAGRLVGHRQRDVVKAAPGLRAQLPDAERVGVGRVQGSPGGMFTATSVLMEPCVTTPPRPRRWPRPRWCPPRRTGRRSCPWPVRPRSGRPPCRPQTHRGSHQTRSPRRDRFHDFGERRAAVVHVNEHAAAAGGGGGLGGGDGGGLGGGGDAAATAAGRRRARRRRRRRLGGGGRWRRRQRRRMRRRRRLNP